ncbi:MAG: hypothetical protein M3326_04185 [Actinomycetota bacterium]|nr:hypothetical protein [Actinomycetota bacterium]
MKALVAVLAVVVLLFAVTIGLGRRHVDDNQGDPANSRLRRFRELLVGDRRLEAGDVDDVPCFDAASRRFVVAPGRQCDVAVPDKVRRIELTRDGGQAIVRLASPDTGTQRAEQDQPRIELDVHEEGSTLSLTCAGTRPCMLGLP